MVICEKYKIIFMHIPKTAGTSIKTILIKELGGIKIRPHVAARFIHEYINEPLFKDEEIFGRCIYCGEEAKKVVYFAKSY